MVIAGGLKKIFSVSIHDVLERNRGVGPGFDLVRIGLALAIFYGHCFYLAGTLGAKAFLPGTPAAPVQWTPLIWSGQHQLHWMLVPMFFALSGFLVTGSAFRTRSIREFALFRILRIVPALFTEVVLSALVLGPLLTTMPLGDYFRDSKFLDYFGNIIGRVRFELPGLFLDNPQIGKVNINLWTLPYEFDCYAIIAVLIVLSIIFSRRLFTALLLCATLALTIWSATSGSITETNYLRETIVFYFFVGCFIYHWRAVIPVSLVLCAVAAVLGYLLMFNRYTIYIAPFFITYVVCYLGMVKFPRIGFIQRGDYSYGVYLYGCPIAQALLGLFPQFRGHGWWVLIVGLPLTFAFANLSWHFVEKPVLALKRRLGPRKTQVAEAYILAAKAGSESPKSA